MKMTLLILISVLLLGCQEERSTVKYSDDAILHVENCVCERKLGAQNTEPWNLGWGKPEVLREQIAQCTCTATIDMQKVKDPSHYVVPGTIIK